MFFESFILDAFWDGFGRSKSLIFAFFSRQLARFAAGDDAQTSRHTDGRPPRWQEDGRTASAGARALAASALPPARRCPRSSPCPPPPEALLFATWDSNFAKAQALAEGEGADAVELYATLDVGRALSPRKHRTHGTHNNRHMAAMATAMMMMMMMMGTEHRERREKVKERKAEHTSLNYVRSVRTLTQEDSPLAQDIPYVRTV